MFNLPTYRITPSAHPIKCLPQCPSPSYPIPSPTSPSTTLYLFPRVRNLSWFVSLSNFSHSVPLLSLIVPFPIYYIPFHYFLYFLYEWNKMMIVLLQLTYFTEHNTLQFHPHQSKRWVSVVSNGWVIFRCIHRPHLLYPFIFRCNEMLGHLHPDVYSSNVHNSQTVEGASVSIERWV